MRKSVFSLILLVVFGFGSISIPTYADQIGNDLSVTGFAQLDYKDRAGDDDFFVDRIRLIGAWKISDEFLLKLQGDYRDHTRAIKATECFISYASNSLPEWKFQAGRIFVWTGAVFPSPQQNPFIGYSAINKEWCDITGMSATWENSSTICQLALVNEDDTFSGDYDDLAASIGYKLGNGVSLNASGIRSDTQHLWTSYINFPVGKECKGKIVFNSDELANRRGRYIEFVWARGEWEVATSYGYESSVDASDVGRLAVSRIFQDGKFPLKLTSQVSLDEKNWTLWVRLQVPIAQ